MLFGTAYYPEYYPEGSGDRLDSDIELMLRAGINYVRLGESTWHLWEPEDGRFAFNWIERVVDRCHRAGIASVIGTPTYAVPGWLVRRYPEILVQGPAGRSMSFGTRQNVDITAAAYLFHAERVIRASVGHFAGHPGVIGFQADNETGVHLLHNPGVRRRFADWCRHRYGTVERLNEAWGTNHWALALGDWADLWPPDNNSSPGYDLAWRRFQTELVTGFIGWQVAVIRELARPGQFITHCSVGGHATIRPSADSRAIGRVVDVAGVNPYYSTQDTLNLPDTHRDAFGSSRWLAGTGVWALYLQADLARIAGRPFLALETNASNAGYPHENFPAYPGQWRQAAVALVARGARGIGYWHWHSCHSGKEIFWRGILGHDGNPGRCYGDIAMIGADLTGLAELIEASTPDAEVAFLYSPDSKYALSFLPPLAVPGTETPDADSYATIFDTFYRGYFDAGLQVQVLDDDADFTAWPVLVVPAAYVLTDELAQRLSGYAAAGGHLVLTFRTGYADEHGRARPVTAPGSLATAAGVRYQEYTNLRVPIAVRALHGTVGVDGARATAWADLLEVTTAEPVLGYDHPAWEQFPAVTTNRHGSGRVTWVGTLPDPALARQLARWSAEIAGVTPAWKGLPGSVRADSASLTDGRTLWFLTNWSGDPAIVALPYAARDALTGDAHALGDRLTLAARDVRYLLTDRTAEPRDARGRGHRSTKSVHAET